MGTKDREGESLKTEVQKVGRVQGDDWWGSSYAMHKLGHRGEIYKQTPTRRETSACSKGLAALAQNWSCHCQRGCR